ncbi:PilZ domain-containing protein [Methylomonas koyamae]|uniref:Pilus assembly protein PilZ n=1 Tax=Methylomonas koyamae TaxID=702114 RepID=A0A291IE73_9GAMM|nr:PilZ domain-containing protein [Methylomonas koyamae]ATG88491.1 pilus assembly protein PilZ [Methylomonas koyamae]OAI24385.1 pilus assembly protein PilZ [Methylomonas koyamae]
MFATENRAYRKSLASHGLLYLGLAEHEIVVVNLSITGLLALLKVNPSLADIKDIFRALQVSPLIDFYLPDMNLAGEAEVVRAESVDAGFQIAVEFRNLSYDVDNLLYSRRAYRKNISAAGHIVFNDTDYAFNTENVSIDGIMIRMLGRIAVEEGTVASFDFHQLGVEGEAKVVWIEYDEISTLMGLQYLHLRRGEIVGVPKFTQPILKLA